MMSLRNLVLVTLLAAASAKRGNFEGNAGSPFAKQEYKSNAYKNCRKAGAYNKEWYKKVQKTGNLNQSSTFHDCGTTPATCELSSYGSTMRNVKIPGHEGDQYSCMMNIAIAECARANHFTKGLSLGADNVSKRQWIEQRVKKAIDNGSCGDQEARSNERTENNFKSKAQELAYLQGLEAFHKTIDTAEKSQQTTGRSSDNTVLIVVVALLAVFALAVGVWVGRLSSEMKIPQDAQMGPVGIETV